MGHSRAAKADTHQRIVAIAAKLLREQGLDGVGVAEVMQEAGLTVGGFYKHFDSRDDLIREALDAAFGNWRERADAAEAGGPPLTLQMLVEEALSIAHRDNPGDGCPVAALAADVARADDETRAVFTSRIDQNIDMIARLIPAKDAKDKRTARAKAILIYAALSGATAMARVVSDEALSREILTSVAQLLE